MASIWDSGGTGALAGSIKLFNETVNAPGGTPWISFSTITFVPNDPFDKDILVCGVWQRPGIDYTDLDESTVQFVVIPTAGEPVTIKKIGVV